MPIERAHLSGPGVRVLNVGGATNPDVLQVESRHAGLVVVKDYARRPSWVRRWLAPRLIDRELAMIRRVQGVPGVPRAYGRIDSLAFALEWMEGQPLRRRTHRNSLPPSFFLSLEAMLEALRFRGVFYTDLRSPTNVLCTPTQAPVLVDIASAIRAPLPRSWVDRFNHHALAKLRSRFASVDGARCLEGSEVGEPAISDLRVGADRIRRVDVGPLGDPRPVVVWAGAEYPLEALRELLAVGAARGRRVLGIARPMRPGLLPRPESQRLQARNRVETQAAPAPEIRRGVLDACRWFARACDALRLEEVDLIALGSACAAVQARGAVEGGMRVPTSRANGAPHSVSPDSKARPRVHALLTLDGTQSILPARDSSPGADELAPGTLWDLWMESLSSSV